MGMRIHVVIILLSQICVIKGNVSVTGFPETSIKGKTIKADCTTPAIKTLEWYRNGTRLTNSVQFGGSIVGALSSLSFVVQPEDEGLEYVCKIADSSDSVTKVLSVVYETPSNPVFQGNVPSDFVQGVTYTLTCKTSGGKPAPSLSWTLDGVAKSPTTINVVQSAGTYTVTITLDITPTSSDDKKVVKCHMTHTYTFTGMRNDSFTLNVLYPPGSIEIKGFPTSSTSGTQENVNCTANGGNPTSSIAWYRDGTLIEKDVQSSVTMNGVIPELTSKLLITVTPADRAVAYNCTVWNSQGTISIVKRFSEVYIAPVDSYLTLPDILYENKEEKFQCTVDDVYPLPNIYFSLGGTVLNDVDSKITSTTYGYKLINTLTYTPVGSNNQEILRCVIGHPKTVGTIERSAILTVHVKPQVQAMQAVANIKFGNNVTLNCSVTSTLVSNVTWYKISGSSHTLIQETPNKFRLAGTILEIQNVNLNDEGLYFCKAKSDAGESEFSNNSSLAVYTIPVNTAISTSSLAVAEGSTFEAICSTIVNPPDALSYKWTFNDGSTSTVISNNKQLSLENVNRQKSGTYTCDVVNLVGQDSKSVVLDVQYKPEATVGTREFTSTPGSKVTLTCDVIANPEVTSFSWTRGGADQNADSETYEAEVFEQTTIYYCSATNIVGTSNSISYTIIGTVQTGASSNTGASTTQDNTLSSTEIAAIVLTVLLIIAVGVAITYCCFIRGKNKKPKKKVQPFHEEDQDEYANTVAKQKYDILQMYKSYPDKTSEISVPTRWRFSETFSNHDNDYPDRKSPLGSSPPLVNSGQLKKMKTAKRHGHLPPLKEQTYGEEKVHKETKKKKKSKKQKFWKREDAEGQESPRQFVEITDKGEMKNKNVMNINDYLQYLPDGTLQSKNSKHESSEA